MAENKNENIGPDEISLKEVILKIKECWQFIVSKWITILVVAILGASVGFIYAFLQKKVYKAELTFALEDDQSSGASMGGALGLASQFGLDLGGGGGGVFTGDNLIQLMKSRYIIESSLLTEVNLGTQKETLADLYIDFNGFRKKWSANPNLRNLKFLPNADKSKFTITQDSILGIFCKAILKKNLAIDKVDKKLSIINVNVNSENELFSKYFAQVLLKTVSNFYIVTKTKKSTDNVNILQRQVDSVRRELNAAITGVASSIDVSPNPNPSLQILRVPSQRRQVDVQTNQAILNQLVANLEISKMSLRKETPLVQVIDYPTLPLEEEHLSKLITGALGGVIAGLLTVIILLFKYFLKRIN